VVREDIVFQFDEGIRRTRKMALLDVANSNDLPPVIRSERLRALNPSVRGISPML